MPSPAIIADIDALRTYRGQPTAVLEAVRGVFFLGARIVFVSGRSQRERPDVLKWLESYAGFTWDGLYMRCDGDLRLEREVKTLLYDKLIRPHYDIRFVIDEGFDNADMWRELGLTVFQVLQDR